MPFDKDFAQALVITMKDNGWDVHLPSGSFPNPLNVEFAKDNLFLKLLIHARRITSQRGGRPEGELHLQMIFDGDQRGAGGEHRLRFVEGMKTLLWGFYPVADSYMIAAYDPDKHRTYGYSKSLQVKQSYIEQAAKSGIAFQTRQTDEVVVIFHINHVLTYLDNAEDFHNLTDSALGAITQDESLPPAVKRALKPPLSLEDLPELQPREREQAVSQVTRLIRDYNFTRAIKAIYNRCAICDFQHDYLLDVAHIVSVADGGTDTYDNGFGLCPICHRMFDRGFILVDETGKIYINPRYAEEYDQLGLAGSLDRLRVYLREFIWRPDAKEHQPSPENLCRTFNARR